MVKNKNTTIQRKIIKETGKGYKDDSQTESDFITNICDGES